MENCKNCGKEIINPTKSMPKGFCSYGCYEQWTKFNKTPNCECTVCGRKMYMKPSRLKRVSHGITCSIECASLLKSEYMMGKENHQFGLKGNLNSSFKDKDLPQNNNGLIDIMVYVKDHPFGNRNGRVKKHRLVVEQNYHLFDSIYFMEIGGKFYLKPEIDVHHKDFNHDNNDISNLIPLTRREHTSIHNKEKEIIRNSLGQITGVIKREELLGNLEADNQQPSLGLTTEEGSETNS